MLQSSQGVIQACLAQGIGTATWTGRIIITLGHARCPGPHLAGILHRTGRGSWQKVARPTLLGIRVHWRLRRQAAGAYRCLRPARLLKIAKLSRPVVLHTKLIIAAGPGDVCNRSMPISSEEDVQTESHAFCRI